jgi:hypothetical protein
MLHAQRTYDQAWERNDIAECKKAQSSGAKKRK